MWFIKHCEMLNLNVIKNIWMKNFIKILLLKTLCKLTFIFLFVNKSLINSIFSVSIASNKSVLLKK